VLALLPTKKNEKSEFDWPYRAVCLNNLEDRAMEKAQLWKNEESIFDDG
jgi:hypothetical protein